MLLGVKKFGVHVLSNVPCCIIGHVLVAIPFQVYDIGIWSFMDSFSVGVEIGSSGVYPCVEIMLCSFCMVLYNL